MLRLTRASWPHGWGGVWRGRWARPFTLQREEAVWGAGEPHDLPGGLLVFVMTFSLRVSVSPAAAWM